MFVCVWVWSTHIYALHLSLAVVFFALILESCDFNIVKLIIAITIIIIVICIYICICWFPYVYPVVASVLKKGLYTAKKFHCREWICLILLEELLLLSHSVYTLCLLKMVKKSIYLLCANVTGIGKHDRLHKAWQTPQYIHMFLLRITRLPVCLSVWPHISQLL